MPATPASSRSAAAVRVAGPSLPPVTAPSTSAIRKLPVRYPRIAIPSRKPTSPTRVTRNALTAARGASGSVRSWPISKYEQMPMTSQPTSSSTRSPATTTVSIAAVKRLTCAA